MSLPVEHENCYTNFTVKLTFSIVVTVDMESVEQLIVVVSHEVHGSGTRLNNTHHLQKDNEMAGPFGMRTFG